MSLTAQRYCFYENQSICVLLQNGILRHCPGYPLQIMRQQMDTQRPFLTLLRCSCPHTVPSPYRRWAETKRSGGANAIRNQAWYGPTFINAHLRTVLAFWWRGPWYQTLAVPPYIQTGINWIPFPFVQRLILVSNRLLCSLSLRFHKTRDDFPVFILEIFS